MTDTSDLRRGFPIGVLKLVITRPDLCIGFAGSVTGAMDAIRAISDPPLAFDEAVEALLVARSRADGAMDFIVAAASPLQLVRIASHEVEILEATYIGDTAAYDAYQRQYQEAPETDLPSELADRAEDFRVALKMSQAMTMLIRNGNVPSVGETAVSVLHERNGFTYAHQAMMMGGFEPQVIPPGIATAVRFGTAATGGFGYSVLTPRISGAAAVGVHFFQGRLGLLYAPLRSDEPTVYRGVSHEGFCAAVENDFGIALEGIRIG